jgi:hypothetical protein
VVVVTDSTSRIRHDQNVRHDIAQRLETVARMMDSDAPLPEVQPYVDSVLAAVAVRYGRLVADDLDATFRCIVAGLDDGWQS